MKIATQWRVSTIALAAAIVLLTGCAPASAPSSGKSETPASTKTPTPSATPTPTPTEEHLDLSFDAGAGLDPTSMKVGWDDHFQVTPGFSVRAPDDGNGTWAYLEDSTQCEIWFHQGYGPSPDLDPTKDERTLSDNWIGSMMQVPAQDVADHGYDDTIPIWGGNGTIAARTLGGYTEDGGSRVDSARVFLALQSVLWMSVTCPAGQDAFVERDKLTADILGAGMHPVAP